MSKQKATTIAVLPESLRRTLQDFLLIWLGDSFDQLQDLRHIATSVIPFSDVGVCVDFLTDIKDEKVFMIVSDSLGRHILPEIYACLQLHFIYVLCSNQPIHESWVNTVPKVKGLYTQIGEICTVLQKDRKICEQSMISISYHGVDALFMYTQLLKEALLDIDDDNAKSIKELAEYCRVQSDSSEATIKKLEKEYGNHSPIWWYTGPYFIYSMLNRGLRLLDVDIILKMGFFIRDLHHDIEKLHQKQQQSDLKVTKPFTVYRGQGLSIESFNKMKQTTGGLMSFNNFLSKSENRKLSLDFAQLGALASSNMVGILFIMTIDPAICLKSSIPFVIVKEEGFYNDDEAEILFTTHTIFRIDHIQPNQDNHSDQLWQVNLTLTGNDDHELKDVTTHMQKELGKTKGWSRVAYILIKLGDSAKAKQLYEILLEKASSEKDLAEYSHQLGWVLDLMGEYSEAIVFYEKTCDFYEKTRSPTHSDLATFYNNIGNLHKHMGEYSKALSSYERSLEIRKIALPPNHLNFASSYENIGSVYSNMGEYSKALSSHERSLEIRKIALPPNHPSWAISYNNIGNVHKHMGEYSKALSSYELSLEIQKIALPPNHLDFATSYNNIGNLHKHMGEYSKALSLYERSLEIQKTALSLNHPDLATSYNNIGNVHKHMGEYSKAVSSYERSLEIQKTALPSNHSDLAISYKNIGNVHIDMGEYSKPLSSYERSLEIQKLALPPNHPDLASSYGNIGNVYFNMGEYSKALSSYERSLEIQKLALSANHLDLAASYNSIGLVYSNMGEYSKALSSYELSLEIRKTALRPNHPDLASSYNNK
ncbi:unnamed protein product [Rotaria sp. Silwood1]|nr:unnamed protein product [Rotaria sp. Silwood1]